MVIKLVEGRVQIGVHDDIIIFGPMADFVLTFRHATGDDLFTVLAPPAQTAVQFGDRGRQHEDRHHITAKRRIADLLAALPVDVKHRVAARLHRGLHRGLGGAVEIAEHLGMFQHLARRDHLLRIRRGCGNSIRGRPVRPGVGRGWWRRWKTGCPGPSPSAAASVWFCRRPRARTGSTTSPRRFVILPVIPRSEPARASGRWWFSGQARSGSASAIAPWSRACWPRA